MHEYVVLWKTKLYFTQAVSLQPEINVMRQKKMYKIARKQVNRDILLAVCKNKHTVRTVQFESQTNDFYEPGLRGITQKHPQTHESV